MKKHNVRSADLMPTISIPDAQAHALSHFFTSMGQIRAFPAPFRRQFVLKPTPLRGRAWARCRPRGAAGVTKQKMTLRLELEFELRFAICSHGPDQAKRTNPN
jgi:hypothetical protein